MTNIINTIRIAGIVRESIVDGPGIRFVIFAQGCPHKCPKCHNAVTHDFDGGYSCSIDKISEAIDENPLLSGVTFSGGEPACQPESFLALAELIEKKGLNIIMYSGYMYEQLEKMADVDEALDRLLGKVDILIDGRYMEEERDLTLAFRGSRNQRIIDLKCSRETGRAVLAEI